MPFAAYIILGLFIPLVAVLIGAFQNSSTGAWTFSNIDLAAHGAYLKGFENSLELSLIASILPGIFGLLIAYAIFTAKGRGSTVLRQMVITASGVFANFGGVPLAFLFIASLASTALITGWLNDIGLNIYNDGFTLFDLAGVAVVYMYFQIPLMVLIILPALEGLRPSWREAAENLGARSWSYWRHVGGPVLMPSFLSCLMLLFGSALSAYATAEALTGGTIALVPIQIGKPAQRERGGGPGQRRQGPQPRPGADHRRAHGPVRHAPAEGGEVAAINESRDPQVGQASRSGGG